MQMIIVSDHFHIRLHGSKAVTVHGLRVSRMVRGVGVAYSLLILDLHTVSCVASWNRSGVL